MMIGVSRFERVPLSHRQALAAFMVSALAVAAVDTVVPRINLSIVYSLLVVVAAQRISRRLLWELAAFMVFLTFGVYAIKSGLEHKTFKAALLAFPLVNRTLSALSLTAITAISYLWLGVRQRLETSGPLLRSRDEDRRDFEEISRSLERFAAGMMCGVLTLCIAVIDMIVPGQFNFPILYAVPLVLCYTLESRRMVWMVLPWLLLFTVVGYWLTPAVGVPETAIQYVVKNRVLAGMALIGLSALLNWWMSDAETRPSTIA